MKSMRGLTALFFSYLIINCGIFVSDSSAAGQNCKITGELAQYCSSHGKDNKVFQGYDLIIVNNGVTRVVRLKFNKNSNRKFVPGETFRVQGILKGKVMNLDDDSRKSIDQTNSAHSTTCTMDQTTVINSSLNIASASTIPVPLSLSSKPGATSNLYLNFGGSNVNSWGSYSNIVTPPYDQDGITSSFSSNELASMTAIWQRVAEKYSPFNMNVTTVDPGNLTDKVTLRIDFGGNSSWLGQSAGGVAYVGSYTSSSLVNVVYVFTANLANGDPKYTAEAACHEAGHGFNLQHQSTYDGTGTKTAEYSQGNGLIAPVMGNSYYAPRGLWWYGTSAISSTSYQDDLAILTGASNGFGFRSDDFGNSIAAAANFPLDSSGAGSISGTIEKISDTDYFRFATGTGNVSFTADVALAGATLDLKLVMYDSSGNIITNADTSNLGESLTTSLSAGTYFIAVSSHGNYGDIAQYKLSGQVIPTGAACIRGNPSISVSPTSQSVTAGNPLTYTLNLISNDSSGCPTNSFNLSYTDSSSDIDGTVSPLSLTLLPGAQGTASIALTSTLNSAGGASSFTVTSSDSLHQSVQTSGTANITVPDTLKPSAPSSLAISNVVTTTKKQGKRTTTTVKLSLQWGASTDNVAVTGYRIFKNGSLLSQANSSSFTYTDSFTVSGTYNYVVKAYDAAGNISDSSNQVTYAF